MQTAVRSHREVMHTAFAVLVFASIVLAAPQAAAQEQAPDLKSLMAMAPEGTWAVLAVDVEQILASEPVKVMQQGGGELPPQVTGTRAMAFFLLPGELPIGDDGPPWCGIILVDPETPDTWQAEWSEDGTEVTIEGATAYETWDGVSGFAADGVVAVAGTQEDYATLLKAQRAGGARGLSERLRLLVEPHSGATAMGAAVLSDSFGALMPEEAAGFLPSYLAGITEAAFGARLGDNLKVSAFARMASAADAAEALAAAEDGIAQLKDMLNDEIRDEPLMALMMQPYFALLAGLKIEATQDEFHATAEFGQAQFAMLGSMGMMPLFFLRGLGGASVDYEMDEADPETAGIINVHMIGLGIAMWRADNDEEYPPDLAALLDEGYLDDPDVLTDPMDNEPQPIGDTETVTSYRYVGTLPAEVPPETILCYTRKGVREGGRNVLSADMTVAFVSEDELADPDGPARTSLRQSYEAVVAAFADDLNDERRAELKAFYGIED